MDYDQFDAEYGRVLAAVPTLDPASAADEMSRLRQLAATIDDPVNREAAALSLASLDDALSISLPPISPAMAEAVRVHGRAGSEDGTVSERIERARAGMTEIGRIAATAEPAEQGAILDLNESLSMLVDALSTGTDAGSRGPGVADSRRTGAADSRGTGAVDSGGTDAANFRGTDAADR